MKMLIAAALVVGLSVVVSTGKGQASGTYRLDRVVVRYSGIEESYAGAIAQVVETAVLACERDFGFDMPDSISVTVKTGEETRLFTDGVRDINLTVRSQRDLAKPSTSGVFIIYGLCHEIGRVAMRRAMPETLWMTGAATQGLADFLGRRLVDTVYQEHGGELWPDKYDYRADGTPRLAEQLQERKVSAITHAAGLWQELAEMIGDKKLVKVFSAWREAEIDPRDPPAALRRALLEVSGDAKVKRWWNGAEEPFFVSKIGSDVAKESAGNEAPAGGSKELARDDGEPAGKRSSAGSGHAVLFDAPGDGWYLTAVRIYGSRYGYPQPPKEDFHVWLCDKNFKAIADFRFPYSRFTKGDPQDVILEVEPTKVPKKFIICVGFNPTRTKGIYVYHDKQASGRSYSGLPGGRARKFSGGDWLIRAVVDRKR